MAKKNRKKKVTSKAQSTKPKPRKKPVSLPIIPKFITGDNSLNLVLLLLLAIGLYFAAYSFGYILDDKIVITDNNFTKKGFNGIAQIFSTESFTGYFGEQKNLVAGARYRPLSIATFAIEYELFGLNPKISHLLNALLYGICGVILFRLFSILFPIHDKKWYWNIPFVTAMIFIAHPIHSEVVANIKGRDEILALIFSLLSVIYALRFIKTNHWRWLLATLASFFLGLLAKENTITFFAVIPLTIYFFYKIDRIQYIKLISFLGITIAGYLILRYQVIGYLFGEGAPINDLMNNPFVGMTGAQKSATIMYTLGKYIWLLFIPVQLTHDYYPYAVSIMEWIDWQVIVSFLIYLGLGVYALLKIRQKDLVSFAILYFIITLSIVSNIVFPVGTFMNERFLFMPSVAFCFLLAYFLVERFYSREKFSRFKLLFPILGGLLFLLFGLKTILRVPDWENAKTLNRSAVKVSDNSARANLFYSVALYNEYQNERNNERKQALLTEMEYYADRAVEIFPRYAYGWQMKAGYAAEHYKKDRDLNKLLTVFENALHNAPQVEFVGTYLEYLNKSQNNASTLVEFYYRVGYQDIGLRQNVYGYSLKYLNYGYQLAPQDTRIQQAISHIRQLSGR